MQQENKTPAGPEEEEGHLLVNIGKIIFLVVVLASFWYFFDKWLSGK